MTTGEVLAHDWFARAMPPNVYIGERTWIYSSFAFLHYRSLQPNGVRIGNDTGIYNGTFFDLGPNGEVEIGNFCAIVGAIISCNCRVIIGDYTFIAHGVVIADRHAAKPRDHGDFTQANDQGGTGISIGTKAWIGARAILLAGTRIGDGAIVGAASVVDFEVSPNSVVAGNPARVVSIIGR